MMPLKLNDALKLSDVPVIITGHKVRSRMLFLMVFLVVFLPVLSPLNAQLRINEVCSSNSTVVADPDHGDFSDWIELHNAGDSAIDLRSFYLSDDTTDLFKWRLPAGVTLSPGEYMLVFADDRDYWIHASFNLNKMGEYVVMSDSAGVIVDSIRVPFLLNDMSYGRLPSDPAVLSVFETPTPGVVNTGSVPKHIAPLTRFSKPGGFYDGPVKITLSAGDPPSVKGSVEEGGFPDVSAPSSIAATDTFGPGSMADPNASAPSSIAAPDLQIYYTLDGSYPTASSFLYTDSIEITATTAVRAIVIDENAIPGIATTQTYFINEPQHLPVFSMVTNPEHLYSDETGIMVQGTNGVPGYCTDIPHNLAQDWERPVNLEFYEQGSQQVLNLMCGTKIFGGCSRIRYPQKSLAFYARSEYEYSSFKYQLFPSKPADDYETFILRAGADDQPHTFFRDPLTHMVVQDLVDVDMQAYRPVVLYINGEYYGIINLREKINEHYVNDNFGIEADSVDMLKRNGEDSWNVVSGSNEDFISMMDFVRGNDLSLPANYAYMTTLIDIDEYINYQVIQVYLGARDWPGNNIKYWKSSVAPYTKWRWVLYDLDHHFKEFFGNIMEESTELDCGCSWPNPPWSTLLFRSMLENETFRQKFITRFNLLSSTVFERERMHAMVNQLQQALLPEMPRHIARWGGQKVTHIESTWMSPVFNSIEEWNAKVQVMHDFIDSRHEVAMQQLHDYFGIVTAGTHHLEIAVTDPASSTLLVDHVPVFDSAFAGNYTHATQLPLEVIPKAGFLLSHWDRIRYTPEDTTVIMLGDEWRYDDSGQWPDEAWKNPGFDDSGWSTGFAELGYGDGDETTVVDYGPDAANKHITTRFRKTFTIDDPADFRAWEMQYKRDDGISVYLNGTEIVRDNQNRYYVGNDTPAEATVSGDEENRLLLFGVNPALIVSGENTLAAEVHQVNRTSSDISFDLQLRATRLVPLDTQQVEGTKLDIELLEDLQLVAHVLPDTQRVKGLFINELISSNRNGLRDEYGEYEDWFELYNAGQDPVNLAGLFLSDTLPAANPWQFSDRYPEVTTVQPNGFVVMIADNEPFEGPLHVDFRLSNDGDEIALLQKLGNDTVVLDHVVFGKQYRDVSWGRYPDGASGFEWMERTTPWMTNYFAPLGKEFTDSLFINEIQAANIDKFADEAGDYEDWIEIYNAGSMPVDVGGLYLADSMPVTKKWQFPLNRPELTTIAPDSFIVVIADEEPLEGALHANFRLAKGGEEVVLLHILATDTTILDHLVYGEQFNNVTFGRYPDGADQLTFMPVNTPWYPNFWEPLDTTDVANPEVQSVLHVYPNPSEGRFFVAFEGAAGDEVVVSVYTISGMKIYEQSQILQDRIEVSLDSQPAGMYLFEIVTNGRRYVERVVKR